MGEIIPIHGKKVGKQQPETEQPMIEVPRDWLVDIEARRRRASMNILPRPIDPIPGSDSGGRDTRLTDYLNDIEHEDD